MNVLEHRLVVRGRAAIRDLWIGGVLLVIIVGFSIGSPYFLTRANWLNTSSTAVEVLLLAVGETFVICSGGIDLSVGAVLGFSGTAGAWAMAHGFPAAHSVVFAWAFGRGAAVGPIAAGFAVTVLAGAVFGLVNGLLVARAGIPPFVVTLGTLGMATGLGYLLNNGQEISAIPPSVATFGNYNLGGWVPVPVLITAVITIWCGLLLAKTRFGAYALTIGDSREAAVRAGIDTTRYLVRIYLLSGALAGVAGVLVMARLGAGSPDSGATDNLNAIAAVVIGGASLFGGRGTVIGSAIGTGIISVLLTGLILINVPSFWQEVVVGAVLIIAVYIDQLRNHARPDLAERTGVTVPANRSSCRRVAVAALAAAALAALAACSSSSSAPGASSSSPSSPSGASSPAAKHYTIAYVPGATGVAFYDTLLAGMKAKAASLGMTVLYQGSPNFAPADQTPIVEAMCTKHPSVLIVSPTDPVAMAPAIDTCLNAGIPVITVDTGLTNTSQLTSEITTNNESGGKAAADFVGRALGGKGTVALESLSPTATTQVERISSFTAEMKSSFGGITVLPVQYTTQATSDSETVARSILAAHPGVKAFFGSAEPNAEGTAAALKALGLTGKVLNVGFDASPAEVALLKSGEINATVAQPAGQEGADAAQFAYDKITGDTGGITFSVQLPDVLLTQPEVSDPAYEKYFYIP
jgi:ribose/xylose/arabinose/galactoside ABC-type transport system permease subunit/ABC-type sugar transport system substrate-binding protein